MNFGFCRPVVSLTDSGQINTGNNHVVAQLGGYHPGKLVTPRDKAVKQALNELYKGSESRQFLQDKSHTNYPPKVERLSVNNGLNIFYRESEAKVGLMGRKHKELDFGSQKKITTEVVPNTRNTS